MIGISEAIEKISGLTSQTMKFNIIIRSILNFKGFSEISVASGVVVDSNANHEFNENYIKAKALIDLFK